LFANDAARTVDRSALIATSFDCFIANGDVSNVGIVLFLIFEEVAALVFNLFAKDAARTVDRSELTVTSFVANGDIPNVGIVLFAIFEEATAFVFNLFANDAARTVERRFICCLITLLLVCFLLANGNISNVGIDSAAADDDDDFDEALTFNFLANDAARIVERRDVERRDDTLLLFVCFIVGNDLFLFLFATVTDLVVVVVSDVTLVSAVLLDHFRNTNFLSTFDFNLLAKDATVIAVRSLLSSEEMISLWLFI